MSPSERDTLLKEARRLRQSAARLDAMAGVSPDLIEFYKARAEQVSKSTEEDDLDALLAAGLAVTRECVRQLRRDYAPKAWRRRAPRAG